MPGHWLKNLPTHIAPLFPPSALAPILVPDFYYLYLIRCLAWFQRSRFCNWWGASLLQMMGCPVWSVSPTHMLLKVGASRASGWGETDYALPVHRPKLFCTSWLSTIFREATQSPTSSKMQREDLRLSTTGGGVYLPRASNQWEENLPIAKTRRLKEINDGEVISRVHHQYLCTPIINIIMFGGK